MHTSAYKMHTSKVFNLISNLRIQKVLRNYFVDHSFPVVVHILLSKRKVRVPRQVLGKFARKHTTITAVLLLRYVLFNKIIIGFNEVATQTGVSMMEAPWANNG